MVGKVSDMRDPDFGYHLTAEGVETKKARVVVRRLGLPRPVRELLIPSFITLNAFALADAIVRTAQTELENAAMAANHFVQYSLTSKFSCPIDHPARFGPSTANRP